MMCTMSGKTEIFRKIREIMKQNALAYTKGDRLEDSVFKNSKISPLRNKPVSRL